MHKLYGAARIYTLPGQCIFYAEPDDLYIAREKK
jgi:hypothetical protein